MALNSLKYMQVPLHYSVFSFVNMFQVNGKVLIKML